MVRKIGPSVKPVHNVAPIRTAIAHHRRWRAARRRNKTSRTCPTGSSRSSEIETMPTHKFRIGQIVTYRPAARGQDPRPGSYMIIARLPQSEETGEFEYRIQKFEREARTSGEGE